MATVLERLDDFYQINPVCRAVLENTPIISVIDAALHTAKQNKERDNLRIFFNEIGNGTEQLTSENIKSNDFLHAFVATTNAVSNTHQREKVRYFARLLTSSINSSEISTIDGYEDYLHILNDLSYRELWILVILSRYERDYYPQAEMSDRDPARFWDQFSSEVCSKFSIPSGELSSILTRLNRSGLYRTFTGYSSIAENSLSYDGRIGELTSLYRKFENLIRLEEGTYN